jgi:hypothetical protein
VKNKQTTVKRFPILFSKALISLLIYFLYEVIKLEEIKNIRTLINHIKATDKTGWFAYQGKSIFIGHQSSNREVRRKRFKELYWQRRSAGLCVHCGIRQASIGRLCSKCKPKKDPSSKNTASQ